MLNRRDFRAITRSGLTAASGAALVHFKILGGLLLLSAP
jgi:hypothetical protein